MPLEPSDGFFDGELEDVVDGFAFEFDLEGVGLVAFAFALGAGDVEVAEELHFDFLEAVAGAAFAAALRQLLRQVLRAIEKFPQDPAGQAHFVRTRVKRLQKLMPKAMKLYQAALERSGAAPAAK